MKPLNILFRYTLNNVVFGITLMVMVALYIAIGSGMPSVREYFEMDPLQFFNAWPLKVMMLLLCITLAVVTLNRIPLTPPPIRGVVHPCGDHCSHHRHVAVLTT